MRECYFYRKGKCNSGDGCKFTHTTQISKDVKTNRIGRLTQSCYGTMEHILSLPFELKEHIVHYLTKSDILNLICCCKQLNEDLKYFLYYSVNIELENVWKLEKKSLENLKLTKVFGIYLRKTKYSKYAGQCDWLYYRQVYNKLIDNCNILNTTEFKISCLDNYS